MQVRAQVFVVEQKCIWNEVDGVLAFDRSLGRRSVYRRICSIDPPALTKGPQQFRPIISRVVVPLAARGGGLGRVLFQKAIVECKALWPTRVIEIGAQARLEAFYESMGFKAVSEPYDEDGIMHVDMHYVGA
ncbi:hypothetical protein AC1031_001880 [Aphanomyces cochlioides]|nr:hypothetical protein AC1031_001880 [Aphanomyces cochlioides]